MKIPVSLGKAVPGALLLLGVITASAAPTISRFSPPSRLFEIGEASAPYIARFLPDQRFDLQVTVRPDPGHTITGVVFKQDGKAIPGSVVRSTVPLAKDLSAGSAIYSLRAHALSAPGVYTITAEATQSDAQFATAQTNLEIVGIQQAGQKVKNIIICIGDGMGSSHRTAARIVKNGVFLGKANSLLTMDQFPVNAMIRTSSLNSIITDSSPGASCYSTGNKGNNNQHGVFPDDTPDNFDNPRVENIGEYLARTQGKALGIVTTADVFDSTPGAFGSHTQSRRSGTGICDQFLDESVTTANLRVLLGGGRKWFLPATTPGSARSAELDYVLPEDVVAAWKVPAGAIDPDRDLLSDFQKAGFTYAPDRTSLSAAPADTERLLGLFALSNMNVAKDKIDGRRGHAAIVEDYGFPDQPMLDEMAEKALHVLSRGPKGFILMVEAASIDKQAHNMDSDRWILDTIEFDYAIAKCRAFQEANPDTLVIVTADHECSGAAIIGASLVANTVLQERAVAGKGVELLRDKTVGTYEHAGFPKYETAPDGYPVTTDPDNKMLIGYAANVDRYEDWLTNPQPINDVQQPLGKVPPLSTYPEGPMNRDVAGGFLITGQVPGGLAVHTAGDIPLSAAGRGAELFGGSMDNTDVFFKVMQAAVGGTSR